jgi:ADP-ribosylglycohydrolase
LDLSRNCSSIDEFTENYYAQFVKREDIGTDIFNHIVAKCRPCTFPEVTEVLPVTLAMFSLSRGNTKEAVVGAVNFGRDADSIASMTGSLCGTFSGFSSLPSEWVNYIRTELPEWKIDNIALELAKYIIEKQSIA